MTTGRSPSAQAPCAGAIGASAKTGLGVPEILEAIVALRGGGDAPSKRAAPKATPAKRAAPKASPGKAKSKSGAR